MSILTSTGCYFILELKKSPPKQKRIRSIFNKTSKDGKTLDSYAAYSQKVSMLYTLSLSM